MSEIKHSLLSLSSAHRWMVCPGSVKMAVDYPEMTQSPYAAEGTKAHKVAEGILTEHLIAERNLTISLRDAEKRCDDAEMFGHVQGYVFEVMRLIGSTKLLRVAVEKKFTIDDDLEIGGTADVAFICLSPGGKKVGVIIDLKYGQGVPVEVENNAQLAGYAVAMDLTEHWGPLDRATVYVYQPRCPDETGVLRHMRLTRKDLDEWKSGFLVAGSKIHEQLKNPKTLTFEAGDHCRFCRGQAVCLEYQRHIREGANVDFSPIVNERKLPDVAVLTDEQLRGLVLFRAEIENFLAEVEKHAVLRWSVGNAIPGLKVVHGRGGGRRWVSGEERIAEELQNLGIEEPFTKKLIGIGEAERILGVQIPERLTVKPEPPLKLVSEEDKRIALPPPAQAAALDFMKEDL